MSSWQEYKKKNGITQKVDESSFSQNTMSSWQEYKMRYSGTKQVEQNNSSQNTMSSWQRYKKEQEERQRQEALKKAEEEERKRQESIKKAGEEQKKQEEQAKKQQIQNFSNEINKNIGYGPSTSNAKQKFEERKNGSNTTKQENSNVLPKVENAQPITNVKNTTEASLEAVRINQDLEKGNYGSAMQHIIKGIPSGVVSGVADIGNAALTVEALNLSKGNQYLNSFVDKMSNAYQAMGKESEEDKNTSLNILKKLRDFSGNASNKLLDTAETITDKTSKYQNTNSQIDNKYIKTAGDVSNSIGRMIPSIVSNVALPGSGTIVSGVQSMGGSAMETLNEDRSNLDKAVLTGVAKGTTTATVEKITGGDLVTKGGFDKLVAKGIKSKFKNQLTQRLLYKGYQVAGEMAEEQLENEVGYVIDKAINNEDMPDLKQRWEEASETAKVTGLTTIALNLMGLGGGSIDDVDISTLSDKDINTVKDIVKITNEKGMNYKNDLLQSNLNASKQDSNEIILNETKGPQNQNIGQIEQDNIKLPVRDLDYIESARKYNIDTNDEAVKSIARVTNERGLKTTYNADVFSDNSQNAIWRIKTDEHGNTIREVILNPNATDTNKTLQNVIVHELTHDMEGTKQYNDLKDIVLKYDKGKLGYDEARKSLVDMYSKVYDVNSNDFNTLVDNEAVADILGSKLGDQDFINSLTKENRSIGRKIYDWVVDKLNKLNGKLGYKSEKLYWTDVKNKFENAFRQEFNNNSNLSKFSIQQDQNGNRYVKVDTDQDIFEGKKPKEYPTVIKKYILEQYRDGNKAITLPSNENASITSKTANEYSYPKNRLQYLEKNSKMRAGTELNNLLAISEYQYSSKDDGRHPFAKDGWDYYKTVFEVDGIKFEGLINIAKSGNKRTLYDITKIKRISQNYSTSAKAFSVLLTNSNNSIASQTKNVNNTNTYFMKDGKDNSKIKKMSHYSTSDKSFSASLRPSSNNSIAPTNKDVNTTNKYSMQKTEDNSWQSRLDTLYKNNSKGTTMKDVKYPIQKFLDDRKVNYELDENGNITNIEDPKQIDEFYNRDLKLAPTKSEVKEIKANSSNIEPFRENTKSETNLERYNNYKKNIIKGKETEINSLISYKNESIRNLDNKILEKEALLKNNKDENSKAILKSQIESLKSQKTKLQNSYNEKIDRASSKVNRDKIELETRNMMKKEARDSLKAEVSPLTNDLTKYKDKKAGILFNRETAQRNIDDIVSDSDLATAIKETVFDPVQVHQAEKTREINSLYERINSLDLDKTKRYSFLPDKEIVPVKVDEATLSQLVIEKKITDKDLRNYGFDDAGIKKIHHAADTFTEILDSLYNRMNEEQIKYGYSPIGRIENYFPHFLENKPDTMLGKVASYFGIDLTDKRLPTEIAGRTDTFKPGKTWNSNTQKRRTIKTDYDALTAMERYIQGATEIIYTTEDIQRVREYSKQIRYKYSDKGIQTEIDNIMNNAELTQEAKDLALDGIFKNTENELSNFVTWLDDYANTLAGKKSFADRNMERNIGRNIYSSMSGIESRIAANTIGGNLSVSLTNFAPIAQAAGTTKWSYLLTGMMQTTSNNIKGMVSGSKDTSFVNNSNFLTNRFGTDSISRKKTTQKVSDFVSIPMNAIDEFTSESIVRAKYLENVDKGMSEETALDLADKYAAKIMADRSKGALPIVFNTKNPLSKLITMFQVEPNNIVSNYLKDMPRDASSKVQLTKQATKLMVASYVFNSLIMSIRGGNEVLPDPIRWVSYLVQAITGDDDEKEKAKTDLTESILGNIPFLSNLAGFVGLEDIGRVPISNAMPNVSNLTKLADSEANGKYKAELAVKEFSKPLLYLGLPVGGAQIKKTVEGLKAVSAGGSYKTNKKGEKELQFPVENPNVGDYIRAGVFGKYSLEDSKVYADRGYKALSAKQTKTYEESNVPYKEYIEYLDQKLTKKEDKIKYLSSQDWGTNEKWGIYKNDILSDTKRKEDGGSQRLDAEYMISNGVSKSEFISLFNEAQKNNIEFPTKQEYKEMRESGLGLKEYIDYTTNVKNETKVKRQKGELSESQGLKDKDKIQILLDSDYTDEQKTAIYENYILTKNNTTYPIIKATGIDINEYMGYVMQEFESDKIDDGTVNGKSVSGSSKKKVYEYVNNMDISYEQRLMLLGMKYTLTDNEQTKLYNYVKSLDYTQDEMKSAFKKLKGFTVYNDGRVTW